MDILDIKNKNIFIYIVIIICAYLYFKNFNIKLNVVVGIFAALFIIYIIQKKDNNDKIISKNIVEEKEKLLRPKSEQLENKQEVRDFLFSIQETYVYNPKSFEELIENLNNFFDCYEEVKINNSIAGERFNDMKLIRRDALNALHAIVLSIPPAHGGVALKKMSNALNKLMDLLNYYISDVYATANKYIKENGYNSSTSVMRDSPYMEKNVYDTGTGRYSAIYSYQYF